MSTQVNYTAPNFRAAELSSQKSLSLADYRGKYVLLDFWGTWCAPCLADMVHLKEAYSQTSRSEIEFIGIIGHDTAEKVKAYVDQAGILSPQLMADSGNKLLETYG